MNGAIWVLVLSGIFGFRVGMIGFPDWQVAVETAQVVAGVVDYPIETPFYTYHSQLWTVLHHVLAIPLKAGVSELTLSRLMSGVLGMVTFQALSMFVYALGRSVPLAVGAAALIVFTRSAEYGTAYPIFLLGTVHTYGAIGLSAAVLTVALLGAGCYRSGAMLLGILPCIHPSLGIWTGIAVGAGVLSDVRRLHADLRPALPWFLAGCAVTIASLIFHFAFVYDAPAGATRWSPQDLSVYIRLWDSHRRSIDFGQIGVRLNLAAMVISVIWLALLCSDRVPMPARRLVRGSARREGGSLGEGGPQLLLRTVAASALLAVAMVPLSHIAPERLPRALVVLMPGRWLNFCAMTFVALIIGLLIQRAALWSFCLLLFLSGGLLLGTGSMLWEWLGPPYGEPYGAGLRAPQVIWIATALLIVGALATRRTTAAKGIATARLAPKLAYAACVALLGVVSVLTWRSSHSRSGDYFQDRTNDVFFGDAAAHRGVLLVAGDLYLVQLRTRRPLLIDAGAIDTVMYSLVTGAQMQRILRDVYGLDLFNPPPEAIGAGRVPLQAHRKTWEGYSLDKWRAIRRDFGVTQVLAYSDWSLQLPVASQSRRLLLYDIPER